MKKSIKTKIYDQIGGVLQNARVASGLTLAEGASQCGYRVNKLSRLENGCPLYMARMPISAFIKLLEYLGQKPVFDFQSLNQLEENNNEQ